MWRSFGSLFLANVKEHAPLSAGASVDHGVEVETTQEHVNRAADRGCCVSTCCASSLNVGMLSMGTIFYLTVKTSCADHTIELSNADLENMEQMIVAWRNGKECLSPPEFKLRGELGCVPPPSDKSHQLHPNETQASHQTNE